MPKFGVTYLFRYLKNIKYKISYKKRFSNIFKLSSN